MITFADEPEPPPRNKDWFEPGIRMLHADCMEYMASLPDGAFDLAIVDPPYGNNISGGRSEKIRGGCQAVPGTCHTGNTF